MRVLEKGRQQKGWAIEHRCTGNGNGGGGCNSLLLVEEGDVYATTSSARDDTEHFRTFTCPECGVETDLADCDIPTPVWSRTDRSKPDPKG